MKRTDQSHFSAAPSLRAQRSVFNCSHARKQTFDAGYIVPVYTDEAYPGDTFSLNATFFARLASSLTYPIMDNMTLDCWFFAVPLRLIWDNVQKFFGEKPDPDYINTHTLAPKITTPIDGWGEQSLQDYLGLPINVQHDDVCAFYTRAYNLIYNEWFRHQQFCDSVPVDRDDGPDDPADYILLKRSKRPDYFTSCLSSPQSGDAVEIPLGTTAPVVGNGMAIGLQTGAGYFGMAAGLMTPYPIIPSLAAYGESITELDGVSVGLADSGDNIGLTDEPENSGMVADLSEATAATINSLRLAYQMQKFLERDARGGTRYTEIIRSHFSVSSPDSRLQRPEYLGGGSLKIHVNPVQQTAPTVGDEHKGSLSANAAVAGGGIGFHRSFTEHCVILGLINVRADQTYQYGIPRKFLRNTKFDFLWPEFAHLGEQEVLRKELFVNGTGDDNLVLGYQERYAELRYHPSELCGYMRAAATGTLDAWHMAQRLTGSPELDEAFITENPPVQRVVAITTGPDFIFDSVFDLKIARALPTYSIPGWVDHF